MRGKLKVVVEDPFIWGDLDIEKICSQYTYFGGLPESFVVRGDVENLREDKPVSQVYIGGKIEFSHFKSIDSANVMGEIDSRFTPHKTSLVESLTNSFVAADCSFFNLLQGGGLYYSGGWYHSPTIRTIKNVFILGNLDVRGFNFNCCLENVIVLGKLFADNDECRENYPVRNVRASSIHLRGENTKKPEPKRRSQGLFPVTLISQSDYQELHVAAQLRRDELRALENSRDNFGLLTRNPLEFCRHLTGFPAP